MFNHLIYSIPIQYYLNRLKVRLDHKLRQLCLLIFLIRRQLNGHLRIQWASHCFLIKKAGKQDFMHMIARRSIKQIGNSRFILQIICRDKIIKKGRIPCMGGGRLPCPPPWSSERGARGSTFQLSGFNYIKFTLKVDFYKNNLAISPKHRFFQRGAGVGLKFLSRTYS